MAQSPRPRAGGSERDLSPGRRSGRYFPCNAAQGRCRERSPAAEPTGTRERQHRGAPGFPPRSTPRSVPRGERGCSAGSDTSARGSGDPGRGSGCPAAAGTAKARLSGEAPQWAVRGRGAPAGACPPASSGLRTGAECPQQTGQRPVTGRGAGESAPPPTPGRGVR